MLEDFSSHRRSDCEAHDPDSSSVLHPARCRESAECRSFRWRHPCRIGRCRFESLHPVLEETVSSTSLSLRPLAIVSRLFQHPLTCTLCLTESTSNVGGEAVRGRELGRVQIQENLGLGTKQGRRWKLEAMTGCGSWCRGAGAGECR